MEKIRKGDEVIVTTGKDKGRRGTVVLRVDADRVVVSLGEIINIQCIIHSAFPSLLFSITLFNC